MKKELLKIVVSQEDGKLFAELSCEMTETDAEQISRVYAAANGTLASVVGSVAQQFEDNHPGAGKLFNEMYVSSSIEAAATKMEDGSGMRTEFELR